MAISKAFCNHGLFTEGSVTVALGRYRKAGSAPSPSDGIDEFVSALKRMHITNVWIQLFSRGGDIDKANPALRLALIARLKQENIPWAGWGYCAGKNAQRDLQLIKDLRSDLGMSAFVIDAEP